MRAKTELEATIARARDHVNRAVRSFVVQGATPEAVRELRLAVTTAEVALEELEKLCG